MKKNINIMYAYMQTCLYVYTLVYKCSMFVCLLLCVFVTSFK